MEFKKINELTFECRLTSQDLLDYDISLEDFMKDREKTMDFMHHIMELSAEELNFKPSAGVLSMQVSPLPDDGLLLTFSISSGKDLLTQLLEGIFSRIDNTIKSLPLSADEDDEYDYDEDADYEELEEDDDHYAVPTNNIIESIKRFSEQLRSSDISATDEELDQEAREEAARERALRKKQKEEAMAARVVRFDSFEMFELFCRSCNFGSRVKSALLKPRNEAGYLLILEKGKASENDFMRVLVYVEEFGEIIAKGKLCAMSVIEHSDVVIAKDAVHKIRSL